MIISCDWCAKRYSLDDARVPLGGCQVTCAQCGAAIVVRKVPPPLPSRGAPAGSSPAVVPRLSRSAPPASAPPPTRPAAVERAPSRAADVDDHAWTLTEERVLPRRGLVRASRAVMTAGVLAAIGVAAGGTWLVLQTEERGAPGVPVAERGGGGAAVQPAPPELAPAPPAEVPAASEPVQATPAPGGRRVGPTIGPARTGAPATARRPPATLAKSDQKLLDLLDKKQDAPAVTAPAAGALGTGRGRLDEAAIRGALTSSSGAFSACIARAARADPAGHYERKTLVLEIVVGPSGRVSRSSLADRQYAQIALGRCLVAAASRTVFPAFEGEELLVQAPLKLTVVQ